MWVSNLRTLASVLSVVTCGIVIGRGSGADQLWRDLFITSRMRWPWNVLQNRTRHARQLAILTAIRKASSRDSRFIDICRCGSSSKMSTRPSAPRALGRLGRLFDLDDFCFHHATLRTPKHSLFVGWIIGGINLSDLHREAAPLARWKHSISADFADDFVKHIRQIFRSAFRNGFLERLGLSFVLHFIRPVDHSQQCTVRARLATRFAARR
jgi:hypothetical protein